MWKSVILMIAVVLTVVTYNTYFDHVFQRQDKYRGLDKYLVDYGVMDGARDDNHGGRNAYLQFLQSLLQVNQDFSYDHELWNTSKFTYNHGVVARADGSVSFKIFERYQGNPTKGGSSFLATREPGAVCRIRDHLNGTYTGVCDPRAAKLCSKLIVTLQSLGYMIFRKPVNPLKRIVLEVVNLCTNSSSTENLNRYRRNRVVTWSPGDGLKSARITHNYGRPLTSIMNHSSICQQILRRYEQVSMLGASHTRYQFDYLLEYCYPAVLMVIRKHGTFAIGNIDYRAAHFCKDYPEIVRRHLNLTKYTSAGESLVTVQVGSHDINTTPLQDIVPVLDAYVEAVTLLCQSNVKSILVLAAPPFPDYEQRTFARKWRNNHSIAALNYMVEVRIRKLMVSRIDSNIYSL